MSEDMWKTLAGMGQPLIGRSTTITRGEDFLREFGQPPRWGPTPDERSGQAYAGLEAQTRVMTDAEYIKHISDRLSALEMKAVKQGMILDKLVEIVTNK
jgi:hypothetical protein